MTKFSIAVLCALFAFFLHIQGQDKVTRVEVPGLNSEVTVRRDERWVPYISARSDDDLYFAQGYVTASDRLWQMDLMRRLARGEVAEIFGKAVLEQDKRWRRFNFSKVADESLKHLSPEMRVALESYSRGVNAYITTLNEDNLPSEFRVLQYRPKEWLPTDTILIGKIISDALSTTWRNDLLRASLQGLSEDKLSDLNDQTTPYDVILFGKDLKRAAVEPKPAIEVSPALMAFANEDERLRKMSLERVGLYAEQLAASNNWVISGERTVSGSPILANDPHLAPSAPGIWYMTHLTSPGAKVAGVTFPGVPGIILGHNEHIAWGATNVGPDVQDLYVETFNTEGKYKTPTGWAEPVIRKEIIKIRKTPLKADTEQVEYEVTETRHGPIIFEENGKRYALRWTAFDPTNTEFDAFYRFGRARDWNGFKDALKDYGGAAQNFVYADVKGNIGWYAASHIPIRRTGDGALPYDGSTNDGDWIGNIPFSELPNLYNPPSGLIVTANQRIVGNSYKYTQLSRDTASPWRAKRIWDELSSKPKITMDMVRDVQYDVYNIPVAELAREIVKQNAASTATINVLKAWDGRMTADSQAALIANEIRQCMSRSIADSNKTVPAFLISERILDRAIRDNLVRWLPSGVSNFADLMTSCDKSIRSALSGSSVYGSDPSGWVWGKAWQSRFPHPLESAPLIGGRYKVPNVPLNGSGQTPNVGSAVSMRHITSPGDWDFTRLVIPLGQSGDAASPYFRDQFDAWASGRPMLFPFTDAAVEKAAGNITVLTAK